MLVTGKHPIRMDDGSSKAVEDLRDGDRVLGIGPVKITPAGEWELGLFEIEVLRGNFLGDGVVVKDRPWARGGD